MPIIFISLSESFCEKIRRHGFHAMCMKIQDYNPPSSDRKMYYVSPANSLCFMDGGMDYALSRIIFPGIELKCKKLVRELGIKNRVDKYYLPIGSSIIIDDEDNKNMSLVVAPTMLMPQNVSETENAYYATMAVLYNILVNRGELLENVDILLTSFCCGYGKMEEEESIKQMLQGICDYSQYKPIFLNKNTILNEPNLLTQPKYYQNTEWFYIAPSEIVNC